MKRTSKVHHAQPNRHKDIHYGNSSIEKVVARRSRQALAGGEPWFEVDDELYVRQGNQFVPWYLFQIDVEHVRRHATRQRG